MLIDPVKLFCKLSEVSISLKLELHCSVLIAYTLSNVMRTIGVCCGECCVLDISNLDLEASMACTSVKCNYLM
ncbi:hypothetical protein RIF29_11855 [Crotalaria pallida]|uniref:Uncharacterized protein n=1 Tax=Crotalaria pallida TaxID=3830 RepID=A0AAN9IMJ0_CROPI